MCFPKEGVVVCNFGDLGSRLMPSSFATVLLLTIPTKTRLLDYLPMSLYIYTTFLKSLGLYMLTFILISLFV